MTTEAVVKSGPVVSAGSITKGRKRPADVLAYIGIYASAAFSVLLLVGIIGYVLVKGYSMISWSFLTGVTSVLNDTVGIAGNILNTLYIIISNSLNNILFINLAHRISHNNANNNSHKYNSNSN